MGSSRCRVQFSVRSVQCAVQGEGGCDNPSCLAVDGDTVASLRASCAFLPGQPREDAEVDVGRSRYLVRRVKV